MAIKANFSETVDAVTGPVGRGLAGLGVTANWLTTIGILLTGVAAGLVVTGHWLWAGGVLVFGGLADLFDGAVARARGISSPFGGFYDSVSDRMSDGIILSAILWSVRDDGLLFGLAATALVAAITTSYIRAKAESLSADCSVGLLERAERAVLLMAALVVPFALDPVLWILAIGSTVTVGQRILHVRGQLDPRTAVPAGGRPVARRLRRKPRDARPPSGDRSPQP